MTTVRTRDRLFPAYSDRGSRINWHYRYHGPISLLRIVQTQHWPIGPTARLTSECLYSPVELIVVLVQHDRCPSGRIMLEGNTSGAPDANTVDGLSDFF